MTSLYATARFISPVAWLTISALAATSIALGDPASKPDVSIATRSIRLTYGADITHLPAGRVRVWMPVPQSDELQQIKELNGDFPAPISLDYDSKYRNRILYFEIHNNQSSRISFARSYEVIRQEVRALRRSSGQNELSLDAANIFLAANSKVPVTGLPLKLPDELKLPVDTLSAAHAVYNVVDDHVRYDKSVPGYGNGDTLWVCNSGTGNCTDFHSLFISLMRSRKIPARFEIGFSVPGKPSGSISGYHCWASFHTAKQGWIPVDISEADKNPKLKKYYFGSLTADRVRFSIGRDIRLAPEQDGPPLNYFIYPYAEVNGKPWPQKQIQMKVQYADIGDKSG